MENKTLFLGALAKLRKVNISFVISVLVEQLGSHWMDFHDLIFGNLSRKLKFHSNLASVTGTLRADQDNFLIIYHSKSSQNEKRLTQKL